MATLNHLKKGESLDDKQLVIVNSTNRDSIEQNTSSFTYTFDQPIDRVSKIDVIYVKIPKTYYNVNSDNVTMSINTQTFNENITTNLVVNDTDIANNIIKATNVVDGTIIKTNVFNAVGDVNVIKVITQNTFLYTAGTFSLGAMILRDFTNDAAGDPLTNVGLNDLFVAQYNLEHVLQWRIKIAGILDNKNIDINATDEFLAITGVYNSFPIRLYNFDDTQDPLINNELISDGSPTTFVAQYSTNGVLNWSARISGIDSDTNPTKILIDDTDPDPTKQYIYIAGTFSRQLEFFPISNSITPAKTILYTGSGTKVFIAQYILSTGELKWASKIESNCVLRTLVLNKTPDTISNLIVFGIEFLSNVEFYDASGVTTSTNDLILEGTQNLAVVSYNDLGTIVNRFKIGGSSIDSNIRMDINNNILAVTGIYSSAPLIFYDTSDNNAFTLNINGNFNNIFIAKYDFSTQSIEWATNIYDQSNNVDNVDIGITTIGEIIVLGNYSSLLKFNSINEEYEISKDLINTFDVSFLFLAKYNTLGKFQTRSYIQSQSTGSVISSSIDAKSNNIYISGSFSGANIDLFNSDNDILPAVTLNNDAPTIRRGLLVSYVNNINNYNIDTDTLDKRIICRTLTGTDLNYTLNLNAFAQELGFTTSQKFRATVFGSPINWNNLDVDETNDTVTIVFNIGNITTKVFTEYVLSFKITHVVSTLTTPGYSPYSLAFELSKQIKLALSFNNNIKNTNTGDIVIYNSVSKLFYVIFDINGTFTVSTTMLSGNAGLTLPTDVSAHCVISDTITNINQSIALTDAAKLTLKLEDSTNEIRYNNVSFNTAFPNVAGSSGTLYLNANVNQNVHALSGGIDDKLVDDFQINDQITFASPWTSEDNNETAFIHQHNWTGAAMSSNGQDITLVSDNDKIYITTTGGVTWFQKEVVRSWRAVSMTSDAIRQTAVANANQIFVSTNKGISWIPKDSIRNWIDVSISRNTGQYQAAVVLGGKIYVSNDFGTTWKSKLSNKNWQSVSVSNDGLHQVAVAFNDFIYYSVDSGVTWNSTGVISQWTSTYIGNVGGTIVQLVSNNIGHVYKTINNWVSWVDIIVDNGKLLNSIAGEIVNATSLKISIIGNAGNIYTSSDSGDTWASGGLLESWGAIAVSDSALNQIAVVRYGGIFLSANSGNSWDFLNNTYQWSDIAMSSDGIIQAAVIFNGNIFMSIDGGITWEDRGNYGSYRGVRISETGQYIVAITQGGLTKVSSNTGLTFIDVAIPSAYTTRIDMSATGKYITIGESLGFGKIYRSDDYGVTFATVITPNTAAINNIAMSATGQYQLLCDSVTYISVDFGLNWTGAHGAIVKALAVSASGQYMISASPTSIYISSNYGATWVSTFTTASGLLNIQTSSTGQYQVACGTFIYISSDFGETWLRREEPKSWIAVSISSDGRFQSGCTNTDIYQSTNYGISWVKVRFVYTNIINQKKWQSCCISNTGQYISGSDGKIYNSNDFGLLFYQKIASNGRMYMIGSGEVQVTLGGTGGSISRDFGKTWTAFLTGAASAFEGSGSIAEDATKIYMITGGRSTKVWTAEITKPASTAVPWPPVFTDTVSPPVSAFANFAMTTDGSIRYAIHGIFGSDIIYKFSGGAWNAGTTAPKSRFMTCNGNDGSIILLAGADQKAYLSTNGITGPFKHITQIPAGIGLEGAEINLDGTRLFIQSSSVTGGFIYTSFDSGVTWNEFGGKYKWSSMNISSDGEKLVATDANGPIKFSFNGGNTWTSQSFNMQPAAIAMDGSGSIQTVVTSGREIFRSTTSGAIWGKTGTVNNWAKIAISKTNGTIQTAVPYYGQISVSGDTGVSWVLKSVNKEWRDIAISADGVNHIAVALDGSIFVSADSGNTWASETSPGAFEWIGVAVDDSYNKRVIVANNGDIWTSVGGSPWSNVGSPGIKRWTSISISDDGLHILASAYQDRLYVYGLTASPTTWVAVDEIRNWQDTAISNSGLFQYAVSLGGMLYVSTNQGSTWSSVENNRYWASIAAASDTSPSNPGIVSAVDYNNSIFQSIDNGAKWYVQFSLQEISSIAMSSDGVRQIVCQINGPLYISLDKGSTFTTENILAKWRSVAMSSDGSIQVAVAYDNFVYRYKDITIPGDGSWTQMPVLTQDNWTSIAISADGQKITVSAIDGQIWVSTDAGDNWLAKLTSQNWISVDMTNDGTIQLAVIRNGAIFKSSDSGTTWVDSVTSANDSYTDIAISGTTGQYATALVQGGLIATSNDFGVTWVYNNNQPPRTWIKVDISDDGSKQIAITNDDRLYYSLDFGGTWNPTEKIRNWRDVVISGDGSFQLVSTKDILFLHSFNLGETITLNVLSVNTETTRNDIVYFAEPADGDPVGPPIVPDLLPIHGYNLANAIDYSVIRKTDAGLVDIFIPAANYTPQTLVEKINAIILSINPAYINPFTYDIPTGKISFTPTFSGSVIGLTELLERMGFNSVPNPSTAGKSVEANGVMDTDISGPLNIFVKSDIIGDAKKTSYSIFKQQKIKKFNRSVGIT